MRQSKLNESQLSAMLKATGAASDILHLSGSARMTPNYYHTERQIRDELVRSNLALQDGSHGPLVAALQGANANLANSYVLNWIPEQAEDIYTVLIEMGAVMMTCPLP